ncbi:MAG: ATP-binding protein [Thermodesulfobacteriota bacterium]
MTQSSIFDACPEAEFFGRAGLIGSLVERAASTDRLEPGVLLVGRRGRGKTEVLKRVHAALFFEGSTVAPVYLRPGPFGSAEVLAGEFLKELTRQYLAFRRRDAGLAGEALPLARLESMLASADPAGLGEFLLRHRAAAEAQDPRAALRNAASAAARVGRSPGIPVCLLIDDIELLGGVRYPAVPPAGPEAQAAGDFLDALGAGPVRLVAASTEAGLPGPSGPAVEVVRLEGLDEETSVFMMAELARGLRVEFTSEVLVAAARRLSGCPLYMRRLVWAARRSGAGLADIKGFAETYARELASGAVAGPRRTPLLPGGAAGLAVARAVADADSPVEAGDLEARLKSGPGGLAAAIAGLAEAGLVEDRLGTLIWTGDNVERDFIGYMHEVRAGGTSDEEARTSLVRTVLKDAYAGAGVPPPGEFRAGVEEVLKSFDRQRVPVALFSMGGFPDGGKNVISKGAAPGEDGGLLELPQVIGCFDSGRWEKAETGPPILLARGFHGGRYDSGAEVVWAVAVKEGPGPATLGDVFNFVRRTGILRENFRTTRLARWITSCQGFTREAAERAASEGVMTGGPEELRTLGDFLAGGAVGAGRGSGGPGAIVGRGFIPEKEFEVVLPSASKAELVAARTAEEISTEMGFAADVVGGIKTAVVEACINAFEHGRPSGGKVYLRFITAPDLLEVQVRNPGVSFLGAPEGAGGGRGGRGGRGPGARLRKRGWGITLMKKLMDDVRFEKIKGGTRIRMVKRLTRQGDGLNGSHS